MRGMLAAIALAAALVLAGCAAESDAVVQGDSRFEFDNVRWGTVSVITDTETGVQYMYVKIGNSGGLTALVDADGKQLVKGWEDE